MNRWYRIFPALLLTWTLTGCQEHKTTIFIVDTSGSMKKNGLLDNVKQSIKKVTFDYQPGDTFKLITFDSDTTFVLSKELQTNKDLFDFNSRVDEIKANGNWTNLTGVIDYSLDLMTKEFMDKKTTDKVDLVLYTDGINDPPPHLKAQGQANFEQLFQKYFANAPDKPWFIYYVELDKIDQQLIQAIQNSKNGRVVPKLELQAARNFTHIDENNQPLLLALGAGVLLFIYAIYWKRTSFRKGLLVSNSHGSAQVIDLAKIRLRLFSRSVKIGSTGEVDSKVAEKQARIGVSLLGSVYLKPSRDSQVFIDGRMVDGKQKLDDGQQIEVNGHSFIFYDKAS